MNRAICERLRYPGKGKSTTVRALAQDFARSQKHEALSIEGATLYALKIHVNENGFLEEDDQPGRVLGESPRTHQKPQRRDLTSDESRDSFTRTDPLNAALSSLLTNVTIAWRNCLTLLSSPIRNLYQQ